jgi:hypothetical protein
MSFDCFFAMGKCSCISSLAGAAAGLGLASASLTVAAEVIGLSISSHDYRIGSAYYVVDMTDVVQVLLYQGESIQEM